MTTSSARLASASPRPAGDADRHPAGEIGDEQPSLAGPGEQDPDRRQQGEIDRRTDGDDEKRHLALRPLPRPATPAPPGRHPAGGGRSGTPRTTMSAAKSRPVFSAVS